MTTFRIYSPETTGYSSVFIATPYNKGSGYGYGTVPGGRWTIDAEGGHVVGPYIPYPEYGARAVDTEAYAAVAGTMK